MSATSSQRGSPVTKKHISEESPLYETMELVGITQARYDRARVDKKERILSMVYGLIEAYEKHIKKEGVRNALDISNFFYNQLAQKISNEEALNQCFVQLAKSIEHYAKKYNEIRFYRDFMRRSENPRYVLNFIKVRKTILMQLQRTNYAGLIMDKLYFGFDKWSIIVNKVFANYKNFSQILNQIQVIMEALCKQNKKIKSIKESMNKLTMTTLVECLLEQTMSLEKHFDDRGRHQVEGPSTGIKKNRRGPKNITAKETAESPIKLMKRMCEGPQNVDDLHDSPYKQGSDSYASPNSKKTLNKKTRYPPYWNKMREKKARVCGDVSRKEVEKEKQEKKLLRSLAQLNILNKEVKNLNEQYREVNKGFDTMFRKYLGKFGRGRTSNTELMEFREVANDRQTPDVDYSAKMTKGLGIPYLKFVRLHFKALKSNEVEFFDELSELKDKINNRGQTSNRGSQAGSKMEEMDHEEEHEEEVEEEEEEEDSEPGDYYQPPEDEVDPPQPEEEQAEGDADAPGEEGEQQEEGAEGDAAPGETQEGDEPAPVEGQEGDQATAEGEGAPVEGAEGQEGDQPAPEGEQAPVEGEGEQPAPEGEGETAAPGDAQEGAETKEAAKDELENPYATPEGTGEQPPAEGEQPPAQEGEQPPAQEGEQTQEQAKPDQPEAEAQPAA